MCVDEGGVGLVLGLVLTTCVGGFVLVSISGYPRVSFSSLSRAGTLRSRLNTMFSPLSIQCIDRKLHLHPYSNDADLLRGALAALGPPPTTASSSSASIRRRRTA
jgi:hypothetical protein